MPQFTGCPVLPKSCLPGEERVRGMLREQRAARTLTSRKQPGQGPTRRNRTYWMTLRLLTVGSGIWRLAGGPVVEGDALDAGEGVTRLGAGQGAADVWGIR